MNWQDILKTVAPTVASALFIHSLLRSLPGFYSIRNCPSVYSSLCAPLRKSFSNAIAGYVTILPCIVSLLFCGSPSAVFGSVVAIDINPIKGHLFRLQPHVFKESIKSQPFIADGYTPATVLRPLDLLSVSTSLNHRPPSKVSWGVGHSVSNVRNNPRFCLPASAGFRVTGAQQIGTYYCPLSTIAHTLPSGFSVIEIPPSNLDDSRESPKSLSSNVNGAIVDVFCAPTRHSMSRPEVSRAYDCFCPARANAVPADFDGLIFSFIQYRQLPKNLSIKRDEIWHIYSSSDDAIINEGANV